MYKTNGCKNDRKMTANVPTASVPSRSGDRLIHHHGAKLILILNSYKSYPVLLRKKLKNSGGWKSCGLRKIIYSTTTTTSIFQMRIDNTWRIHIVSKTRSSIRPFARHIQSRSRKRSHVHESIIIPSVHVVHITIPFFSGLCRQSTGRRRRRRRRRSYDDKNQFYARNLCIRIPRV